MQESGLAITGSDFPAANSRLMMRVLRDSGDLSRTSLSEATGLSPTTISKAVAPLITHGWVVEGGVEKPTAVGRPAIVVSPVPGATVVCGVQIGVGMFRVGLADGRAKVLRSTDVAYDPDLEPDAVLKLVARTAQRLMTKTPSPCLAVGVGVPGPVDPDQRVNLLSINLGWRDVHVADRLEESLGLPVTIDHNVRAMALAEHHFGGHDVASMAYVYVKTGVGMGVVLHGEPFVTGRLGISELGHVQVQSEGKLCACGSRGCLETVVSEPALIAGLEGAGLRVESDTNVLRLLESHRQEPAVAALRERVVSTLSRGLGAVMNLINPELIVLGGVFEDAPRSLVADIEAGVSVTSFPLFRDKLAITSPRLPIPGVSGGATLALEKVVYA